MDSEAAAVFTSPALSGARGVRHAFFTREGGVSAGIYATLNCGFGSSDSAECVRENRTRAARRLGGAPENLITLRQVHSARAIILDAPPAAGAIIEADAVVTRTPGLAVAVLTADCAPALLADAEAGVIAAVHAGWRGALGGVLEAAVDAMVSLGASPANMRACIGPAISGAAYEVGPDYMAVFTAADPAYAEYFHSAGGAARPHFDLPRFAQDRLIALGVAGTEVLPLCTYSNESNFFSYRRSQHRGEPDYGRQISAIVIG